MDATLKQIVEFSFQLSYDQLPRVAIRECKRRVIDTFACALGGFNAEPSKMARAIARRVSSENPARVLGTPDHSSPELAAFANGVMIRYLDFNDATGSGGGHPSDMFAALLAAAESAKTDGKTFITAAVAAYELCLGFFAAIQVRDRGWDHVLYTVLGAAAGVAKIMKLDRQRTANALSLLSRRTWRSKLRAGASYPCGRGARGRTRPAMPYSRLSSQPKALPLRIRCSKARTACGPWREKT